MNGRVNHELCKGEGLALVEDILALKNGTNSSSVEKPIRKVRHRVDLKMQRVLIRTVHYHELCSLSLDCTKLEHLALPSLGHEEAAPHPSQKNFFLSDRSEVQGTIYAIP